MLRPRPIPGFVGRGPIALGVVLLTLASISPALDAARADELSDLRAENARLRNENEALRADLEALRARLAGSSDAGADHEGAAGDNGAARHADPSARTVERVFVPRSRVSLETAPVGTSGATSIATPWYRTAEGGPLPRKEWIQFRAQQAEDGRLEGAWMLLDRRTGRGSLESVAAGRLVIDGRVVECAVDDYDVSQRQQTIRQNSSTLREERVRFALPTEALTMLGRATRAQFEAGPSAFELNDAQLTAAAALATRAQARPASPAPAAQRSVP